MGDSLNYFIIITSDGHNNSYINITAMSIYVRRPCSLGCFVHVHSSLMKTDNETRQAADSSHRIKMLNKDKNKKDTSTSSFQKQLKSTSTY